MMVVRSVFRKLKLIVAEPKLDPLKNIEEPIRFCAMTPLQVENSLDKIHLIENLIIGGASVSESLKKKLNDILESKQTASKVYETYGMSETLSHIGLKESILRVKTILRFSMGWIFLWMIVAAFVFLHLKLMLNCYRLMISLMY